MAKKQVGSVDEYLAAQAGAVQRVLQRVRNAIRRAVPRADERSPMGFPRISSTAAR